MRFVDVRNLIGKAFCDYLLTGEEKFRNLYLSAEVPVKFENYKRERVNFYETFIREHGDKIPARGCEDVLFFGKTLNNLGYYFEAHEVVEKFWLTYEGEGTEKGQKLEKMFQLMLKTLSPFTPAGFKACLLLPIPIVRDSGDTL